MGPYMGKSFLIIVDSYTKWIDAVIMNSITAECTIEVLRRVFATHGIPKVLVSDNGPTYTSAQFKEFTVRNGIKHLFSAPFKPSSNGLAERAVQTVKHGLAKMAEGSPHTKLSRFLFKYRITPHSTTGVPPCEALMGRMLHSPLSMVHPSLNDRVMQKQERQKHYSDRHSQVREFNVNDEVFVENYAKGDRWLPGVVHLREGSKMYDVKIDDGRIMQRHVDQMRRRSSGGKDDNQHQNDNSMVNDDENVIPTCKNDNSMVSVNDDVVSTRQSNESIVNVQESISEDVVVMGHNNNENSNVVRRSKRNRKAPKTWV
ncbi:uncharacterized protein K02A2.6-like [Anneissia japonica]|uniref:uncharacterized protein K02A2.6-like n=1 Tax=Anneissia japonica TaxID=1529436 RepID=UPI0014257CF8|nr:uncharacterized protein K02A2.6-like [Anneissia japonica]